MREPFFSLGSPFSPCGGPCRGLFLHVGGFFWLAPPYKNICGYPSLRIMPIWTKYYAMPFNKCVSSKCKLVACMHRGYKLLLHSDVQLMKVIIAEGDTNAPHISDGLLELPDLQ